MKIAFHGAARGVTGSCHRIVCGGREVLVDCGLFQGGDELGANEQPFGFDPAAIDAVLLTHAHLDHCGRLPLLVKRGFRGWVHATSATRDLARLVLLDAAHLNEEDARRRARRAARRGEREVPPPLFRMIDAFDAMDRFARGVRYGEPVEVCPGIRATWFDAGHILGAGSLLVELEEGGRRQRVVFSGDIGSPGRPIVRDPEPIPPADRVVMESTYGDRNHRSLESSVNELLEAVRDTFARGGNVIVPTFALERAQELLFHLREAVEHGRLPAATPVFLDSPMAISATEIYRRHPECYDEQTAALFEGGRDPFALPGLQTTREVAESMAINRVTGGAIILAGSGMCTGGRVLHHLRQHLWREASSVVFVGFAARGTLAREIVDGAGSVTLFGENLPVRARIYTIGGFSAHAGRDELLAWRRGIEGARSTVLVHGEESAMERLAEALGPGEVRMPRLHEEIEIA